MQSLISCDIEVRDLSFSRGMVPIFGGVNFALAPGNVLMVRGTNGSGKTSLLRVLAGFSRAMTGEFRHRFGKSDWTAGSPVDHIGWLGHKNGQKDELTPIQNLNFWKAGDQNAGQIEAVLEKVELSRVKNQITHTLSAGEKRRLALARLVLGNHAIWLMDEPSANLDRDGTHLIERLLCEHVARNGSAIIASHDPLYPDVPVQYIKLHREMAK